MVREDPSQQLGLSLLELIVVITLVSILGSLALPGLQRFSASTRSDLAIRAVIEAIQFTRSSAITQGREVTACRSDDGQGCGGNWEQGILVFVDENHDRVVNGTETVLRYFELTGVEGSLRWRAFGNRQYLLINSLGFLPYQNGSFTYCPLTGEQRDTRQLIVNASGRLRLARDADGDGIREDSRGRPLRCN